MEKVSHSKGMDLTVVAVVNLKEGQVDKEVRVKIYRKEVHKSSVDQLRVAQFLDNKLGYRV